MFGQGDYCSSNFRGSPTLILCSMENSNEIFLIDSNYYSVSKEISFLSNELLCGVSKGFAFKDLGFR